MLPDLRILQGDCLEMLRTLPDESVHCTICSPPYWGLRDYGVAGQLGLEKTPEEYVAKMVEVFREVRRVLRSDGTCWINLGDVYAHAIPGGGSVLSNGRTDGREFHESELPRGREKVVTLAPGLKPKDLCGIPWRLARALQEPYYTGTIKNIEDRIWLAAMIDAEGCMFIHKRKAGQNNGQGYERQNDSYGPGLEVANTSEAIVQRCLSIVGKGSICSQSPDQNNRRKQTIYRWNLRLVECRDIIRELYPHFTAKQHQARIMCGCPTSGPDAEAAHQSLIALHNGGTATIDFPAPKTMFEQGWWLRQDVIWSKCNPMPESVTDRCTKAHEYIFLLAKAERYFYDAEAIKEPAVAGFNGSTFTEGKTALNGERKGLGMGLRHDEGTRNKRSVWTVPSYAFPEAHFATYPPDLIKPCILAGTSARGCCPKCGAPWERVVEKTGGTTGHDWNMNKRGKNGEGEDLKKYQKVDPAHTDGTYKVETLGWKPQCQHGEDPSEVRSPIPCTVVDPFAGSFTTCAVALELGRSAIGIELNPAYVEMGRKRCTVTPGLALS